ncbi:MAG: FHA domain-containing protein, partial [Actinomycetota bacterium]
SAAQGDTGPRLNAQTRHDRTVLSLDVVGSARMKAPGLTVVVHQQFSHFRSYVRRHLKAHACLDSLWAGDGLLALFATPRDGAACAVAILDGLAAFNAGRGAGMSQIRVRMGVHRGPVMMAEGVPLGEVTSRTLDAAGHLQKSCPEDATLLSESTLHGLPDQRGWLLAGAEYAQQFPFAVYQMKAQAPEPAPEAAGALRLEIASRGKIWTLPVAGEMLIGRPDPGSRKIPEIDLRTDDAVSRRHARIVPGSGGFQIEDLDSANGTRLNGEWLKAHTPAAIASGDTIDLGEETVIRVLGG